MPCRDHYDEPNTRTVTEYVDNPVHINRIKELEAAFCAVFSELEKTGNLEQIIANAQVNGKIDLSEFWEKHKKEDETRLRKDLQKYSKHELDMMKNILNNW